MKRPIYIGLAILGLFVALVAGMFGAFNRFPSAVLRAMTSDQKLVLYSLDPSQEKARTDAAPTFREYPILGQTLLGGQTDRMLVVESLRQAARGAWDSAACFNPRHGIRVTDSSGTYDVLLCYECSQAVVFYPEGHEETIPIRGPSTALDQLLEAAHVPLGRRPH